MHLGCGRGGHSECWAPPWDTVTFNQGSSRCYSASTRRAEKWHWAHLLTCTAPHVTRFLKHAQRTFSWGRHLLHFFVFFMPTYGFALQKLSDGVPWAITCLLREADSRELRAAAALPLLCSALRLVCYAALPACCPVRSCNVAFTLSASVLHSTASQYYPACPPHPLNSLLHRSVGINVAGPASCGGSSSPRRMPAAHTAASGRAPERPEGELSGGGRKRAFGCVWQFPRCWRRSNALSLASAVTCLSAEAKL